MSPWGTGKCTLQTTDYRLQTTKLRQGRGGNLLVFLLAPAISQPFHVVYRPPYPWHSHNLGGSLYSSYVPYLMFHMHAHREVEANNNNKKQTNKIIPADKTAQ